MLGYGHDAFARTVVEKLLTYALGRGLEYSDAPTVRRLVRELAGNDYRWSALVQGIVESPAFRMRRASHAAASGSGAAAAPAGQ